MIALLRPSAANVGVLRSAVFARATVGPSRAFATVQSGYRPSTSQPPSHPHLPATLHLKSGEKFTGRAFGAPRSSFGETVFSTSITSYTESLTDPSYDGQILVFTTPMIGNYGVPDNYASPSASGSYGFGDGIDVGCLLESRKVQVAGVIVADLADRYSHYTAVNSLSEWCHRYGIPGITGVDTRAITSVLREQGTTLGKLAVGPSHLDPVSEYWDPTEDNQVAKVSTKQAYTLNPTGDVKIAVLDFGTKANILRSLVRRGASVTVLPWDTDVSTIMSSFDGLFLSNGPGDPQHCGLAASNVRKVMNSPGWGERPIFGICMGNQIIGMAAGLKTHRMRFGNRGHNQPVLALADAASIKAGRCYITSQNHQYALTLEDKFPDGWEPFFINANDASVEGVKSTNDSGKKIWGVQFHPESAGGPLDTIGMFSDFVQECRAVKTLRKERGEEVDSALVNLNVLNGKREGMETLTESKPVAVAA